MSKTSTPDSPHDARVVALLVRVSTDQQDVTRQTEIVRRVAATQYPGAPTAEFFEEDGISATKVAIFDRPQGSRLVDAMKAGRVRAVVADELSRFCRGPTSEWATFAELAVAHDVELFTQLQGNLTNESSSVVGLFFAWHAQQESKEKAHRVKTGKESLARRGYFPGGRRPFGYEGVRDETGRIKLEPSADAPTVLQAFEAVARGRSIADAARAAGQPRKMISEILRNPVYAGMMEWNGERFQGLHQAIVNTELWERVQSRLDQLREAGIKHQPANPLAGLLYCECGAGMRYENAQPWRYYRCRSCKYSHPAEHIELALLLGLARTDLLLRLCVDDPGWDIAQPDVELIEQLKTRLGNVKAGQANLLEMARANLVSSSDPTFRDQVRKAAREEREIRNELRLQENGGEEFRAGMRLLSRQLGALHEHLPREYSEWGVAANELSAVYAWWGSNGVPGRAAFLTRVLERIQLSGTRLELHYQAGLQLAEKCFPRGRFAPVVSFLSALERAFQTKPPLPSQTACAS